MSDAGMVWTPAVEAIAVMHAKQRARFDYCVDNGLGARAYPFAERAADHAAYVAACQAAGVCRHPFCWQPCDWTGADLDADPNAGGWCQHHISLVGE